MRELQLLHASLLKMSTLLSHPPLASLKHLPYLGVC